MNQKYIKIGDPVKSYIFALQLKLLKMQLSCTFPHKFQQSIKTVRNVVLVTKLQQLVTSKIHAFYYHLEERNFLGGRQEVEICALTGSNFWLTHGSWFTALTGAREWVMGNGTMQVSVLAWPTDCSSTNEILARNTGRKICCQMMAFVASKGRRVWVRGKCSSSLCFHCTFYFILNSCWLARILISLPLMGCSLSRRKWNESFVKILCDSVSNFPSCTIAINRWACNPLDALLSTARMWHMRIFRWYW